MQGKIIKGIAGFYYVYIPECDQIFECKAKGIFRNRNVKPLVGDDVLVDIIDNEKKLGNISEMLPRKSELIRPAVANIDQSLLVFAMSEPTPNLNLLSRFLVMMREKELENIICFNKFDESNSGEAERLRKIYAGSGCKIFVTSTVTGEGMEELKAALKGKTTALAGPSGVGKSSILNALVPDAYMETGSISEKIGRGRHTTRHSESFVIDRDTFLLDTPGFTSLSVMSDSKENLRFYFTEFDEYEGMCRYNGCVHVNEPGCAVKDAVGLGKISEVRYEHYLEMYDELKNKREKY